jgi:hypothetical protein
MVPPPPHHAVGQYVEAPLVLSTRELPAPNGLVRECREEKKKRSLAFMVSTIFFCMLI